VLVGGASGLLGTALGRRLADGGHHVVPLVRAARPGDAAAGGRGVDWDRS
jgi:uncharacterized protein YbjT (DUF2867 family)